MSGSAGAGYTPWLVLVCLVSAWFVMLCVLFVAPLFGMSGWDLYVVGVYMVVTGEAPDEVVVT